MTDRSKLRSRARSRIDFIFHTRNILTVWGSCGHWDGKKVSMGLLVIVWSMGGSSFIDEADAASFTNTSTKTANNSSAVWRDDAKEYIEGLLGINFEGPRTHTERNDQTTTIASVLKVDGTITTKSHKIRMTNESSRQDEEHSGILSSIYRVWKSFIPNTGMLILFLGGVLVFGFVIGFYLIRPISDALDDAEAFDDSHMDSQPVSSFSYQTKTDTFATSSTARPSNKDSFSMSSITSKIESDATTTVTSTSTEQSIAM